MKIEAFLSLIFFMGVLSSIQSQLQPPETVVLQTTRCMKNNGKIIKGNLLGNNKTNISDVNTQPINGSCPAGWTLLEPGVIVDHQIVSSKGLCIEDGYLLLGIAVSIGPLVNLKQETNNGKICSVLTDGAHGIVLRFSSIVTIVDENTPLSEVFIVQDDPLITNLTTSFSTITLNDTVCLDSGIIIDGLVTPTSLVNKTYGSCPVATAQFNFGVINDPIFEFFDENTCLEKGLLTIGRVLVESEDELVGINKTLSSGNVCSIADNDPAKATGVVLAPGVILIIPFTSATKRYYSTRKYYEGRGYYKPYERYQQTYQEYDDKYYQKRNRNMAKSRVFGSKVNKDIEFLAEEIAGNIASKLQSKKRGRKDWYDY